MNGKQKIMVGNKILQPLKNLNYKQLYRWAEYTMLNNYSPMFKSMRGINAWVLNRQQHGHDYNILVLGIRGSGKSTFATKLTKEHNKNIYNSNGENISKFNYKNHIVYGGVYDEYLDKYDKLKMCEALSLDEAGKLFFKLDFAKKDVKDIQKMWIADIRKDKKPLHVMCVPDAQNLMKFWRQFETNMIVLCTPRWQYAKPSAFVFELSNVMGSEEKEKLIQRIARVDGSPRAIKKKLMRDKYFSGFITYPDFSKKERELYLDMRVQELDRYNQIMDNNTKKLGLIATKRYVTMFKLIDFLYNKKNMNVDGIVTAIGRVYKKDTVMKMLKISEQHEDLQHNHKIDNLENMQNVLNTIGYTD